MARSPWDKVLYTIARPDSIGHYWRDGSGSVSHPAASAASCGFCDPTPWDIANDHMRLANSPCVGDVVHPTAQLRAWGFSAADKGAIVTRIDAAGGVWAAPLKSTRPGEIGQRGFGWLWRKGIEYRFDPGDLEVVSRAA